MALGFSIYTDSSLTNNILIKDPERVEGVYSDITNPQPNKSVLILPYNETGRVWFSDGHSFEITFTKVGPITDTYEYRVYGPGGEVEFYYPPGTQMTSSNLTDRRNRVAMYFGNGSDETGWNATWRWSCPIESALTGYGLVIPTVLGPKFLTPRPTDAMQWFKSLINEIRNIAYTGTNGTISGSSSAVSGDRVTFSVVPDTGYALSSISVYKTASQSSVDYTKVNDTTYTFVMPDTDVTVTGIFVRAFSVSVACSPSSAGIVTRTPSTELVRPGLTVRVTVTPNTGWQVSTMDFSQDAAIEWDTDTLTGTFIMPERLVYGTIYLSSTQDPNAGGGTSQPEVPSGGFDNDSDIIAIPVSSDTGVASQSVGKGLITIWNPTVDEVADIGQYLYATDWGDALYQGFRDFFVKPLESAISLHVLPIRPTRSSAKKKIMFGPHNSSVSSYQVINQYSTMDMGRLKIEPYWDSYLDYNPFTKIQIFLPFIGTQDLDADIVMGKTIGVRYKFDVLTGACVAFLYTMEDNTPSIFAEFVGESAMQIPLCSSDYSRVIGGVIQAAATVVTGRMVTGSATKTANEVVGQRQVELELASNRLESAKRKRPRTEAGKAAKQAAIDQANSDIANAENGLAMAQAKAGRTQASMYAAELRAVPYEVSSIMGSKANFTISGSVAGGAGLLGSQIPYLIIRRPKQSLPDNYRKFVGYPSNIYAILGSLSGFTRIEQADLKDIPCTDAELAMIYKALKEGVYL